jgi:hypothetical protein
VEASHEKHIPVPTVEGRTVKVAVGAVDHPMTAEHYIPWVVLRTDKGSHRRHLSPEDAPLALFSLGATLDFSKAKANRRLLIWSVLGKLVFVPLVYLSLAVLMGIRDVSLATLIAVFASPVSVSSFPMAQQMGGNDDLAGGQVVFTTAFCILTVFLWVYVLKALGFIG